MQKTNFTDTELISGFLIAESKEKFFVLIVNKFQERLYFFIRRILISHDDTNDVLQEVFIKAWKNLTTLQNTSLLNAWLYKIAHNEAMNFVNAAKRKHTQSINQDSHLNIADENVNIDVDEWTRKVFTAIQTLPDQQRIVFNLRYFDEMPYEEISEVMEISTGAAKAQFHHALKKMERVLAIHRDL